MSTGLPAHPPSAAGSWWSRHPLNPCLWAPASCRLAPVRSYHGEAHVGLLERRPVVGAVPRHGHHLPLLRVCAVDDACGRGGRVLRALGPRGGPQAGTASSLAPALPLPSPPPAPTPSSFIPAPRTCRGHGACNQHSLTGACCLSSVLFALCSLWPQQ